MLADLLMKKNLISVKILFKGITRKAYNLSMLVVTQAQISRNLFLKGSFRNI